MAGWITDGCTGFTINGNVVTHVNQKCYLCNAMWPDGDGDGVSSGQHYWKIEFPTWDDDAGVGFTSKDFLDKGYGCRAIKYHGNLSSGSALLVGSFGPGLKQGDVIGLLAVFEEERLKVYIDVNSTSLGLAFDVPASTFKSIFPMVSLEKSGSAICTKQTEIPNITKRAQSTFTGIEGDWVLTNLNKNGEVLDLTCSSTTKIRKQDTGEYSWFMKVINNIRTRLSKEDGHWKTDGVCTTLMGSSPERLRFEGRMTSLMNSVKVIELDGSGDLVVKSDEMSSTWKRFDSTPGPFVGKPFLF